jgi:hypothetical protein
MSCGPALYGVRVIKKAGVRRSENQDPVVAISPDLSRGWRKVLMSDMRNQREEYNTYGNTVKLTSKKAVSSATVSKRLSGVAVTSDGVRACCCTMEHAGNRRGDGSVRLNGNNP